ncbi:hypothetical protein [Streptomyces sp. NPDC093225]|uniref:protein kinase domain-containing protein n=1 Tax=Streptomyces sp. NPDC093225 TaxID=3366034 RepID=UPI00381338D3
MSTEPPIPTAATVAVAAQCGSGLTLTAVTDRRGSVVWKAVGRRGAAALKVGRGPGYPITAREAAALRALKVDYLPGGGVTADAAWLLTAWLSGPTTYELFAPVRASSGAAGLEQARTAAVEVCAAVAELHAAGWVHADLQPSHALHTATGVKLIDLAWAWRCGWDQGEDFNGGLTHLLAPELAAAVLTGDKPVKVTPAADVYALAATLRTCTTGTWPLDYEAAGIDPKACTPHQLREHIATGTIPMAASRPWPDLQEALQAVLLAGPAARPTSEELAKVLAA